MPETPKRSLDEISEDFQIFVHQEVLGCSPDDEEALSYLAQAYTRLGKFEEGLGLDRRLAVLKPEDPIIRYNLTCSLSLTFHANDALEQLREAIRLGYDDFDHMEKDPDLVFLRKQPEYRELLENMS